MKKLFYVIPIASILLFSCAGTPKNSGNQTVESESEQTDSQTTPNDEAYSERNDNLSVSENTVETAENTPAQENTIDADTENESAAETDYIDETEPLSEMETPDEFEEKLNAADIDELQELDNQYAEEEYSDSDAEEPALTEEPLVRDIALDIALEEDSKLPETDSEIPAENISSANTDGIPSEENSNKDENVSLPETDAQISLRTNETKNETADPENVLNESNENADESPENNNSADESAKKIHPTPSRTMTAKKNQLIEVEYPGRGWIYQGNIDEKGNVDARQKNFVFGGRKLGAENQTFSIRARNPGKYLLHFYKNDALTGTYIDDYLEVNVENEEVPLTSRIRAPDYAKAVPPAVKITAENANNTKDKAEAVPDTAESPKAESLSANETNTEAENTPTEQKTQKLIRTALQNTTVEPKQTVISEPDNISQNRNLESSDGYGRSYYINSENSALTNEENSTAAETPDDNSSSVTEIPQTGSVSEEEQAAEELLALAKNQYESKEYEKALETLRRFFAHAVLKIDEGLFLQGNILESKSNVRNIKNAIDSYDLIVRDYPASPLWDKANKRSIYLKRFYINIR